jgi:phosphatidylglycerophosphatase A
MTNLGCFFFMGFLFFRLFDIWKPFPVGWIDRKGPGALGTMLDDVAAGVMAWITLFAFGRLLPILGY